MKTKIFLFVFLSFLFCNCRKDVAINPPVIVEKTYSFKTADNTQIYHEMLPIFHPFDSVTYNGWGTNTSWAKDSFLLENIYITFSSYSSDNYNDCSISSTNESIEFALLDSLKDSIPLYLGFGFYFKDYPMIKKYNSNEPINFKHGWWGKYGNFNFAERGQAWYRYFYWGSSNGYIAFRIKTTTGYKYGWIYSQILYWSTYTISYGLEK